MARKQKARRYRIAQLVGRGPRSSVYRGKLLDNHDFERDVALKILKNPSEDYLARLSEQARLVAMVSDRALVSIEPPIVLGEHWAVVMEWAEGCTLADLLNETGPPPAVVVLEILEETARVLGKIYDMVDPLEEKQLALQFTPSAIQLTPHGEVKVLDLGLASETHSTGYTAPEGSGGREADMYSLGRVLEVSLTGRAPGTWDAATSEATLSPLLRDCLGLSELMCNPDPGLRPTARDVETTCRKLIAETSGRNLRQWTETHVIRTTPTMLRDGLLGTIVEEQRAESPRQSNLRLLLLSQLALFGLLAAGFLVITLMLCSGGALYYSL